MDKRPLFRAYDPETDSLFVEVPKRRWEYRVSNDMTALLQEHNVGKRLLRNTASGSWGLLVQMGLLRTVAQLPELVGEKIVQGASVSEALWSDRALVTIPHPSVNTALAAGVLAYSKLD